jgi:putative sigma-54 modulation protein
MDIHLITRHLDRTQTLVEHAQRRAAFAFDRFGAVVRGLDIRVSDVNGPRGGTGIACLARLRLVTGDDVLVEGTATSPEEGISVTISRLANRLRRIASRRQDH